MKCRRADSHKIARIAGINQRGKQSTDGRRDSGSNRHPSIQKRLGAVPAYHRGGGIFTAAILRGLTLRSDVIRVMNRGAAISWQLL
jgi:hypothetical protein